MGFVTYWDLSEKQRAALTHDGVEKLAAAELMSAGVLQVGQLVRDPEPEIREPAKRIYYQVSVGARYQRTALDVLFDNEEDARGFLENVTAHVLKTERLNDDWSQSVSVAAPLDAPEVTTIEAVSLDDFRDSKTALEKRAATRAANTKREEEWTKEKDKEREALRGMWADWQACRDKAAAHLRIAETLESYTATAGGDREVAFRFLRKVFKDAQIIAAAEWCEFTAPGPFCISGDRIDEVHAA